MKLIAVETATEACSAALLIDGEVTEQFEFAPRQHTQLILPMVDQLLADAGLKLADLDGLAFGRGPGAFTGVRIATGVIQGLAFAADLPVAPISTLAAMAHEQYKKGGQSEILTAIDARMGEVYWACYECSDEGAKEVVKEQVCPPEQVILPESDAWLGLGSGWETYQQELSNVVGQRVSRVDGTCFPQARYIAMLAELSVAQGKALPASQAMPVYLRDNVAKKKAEQQSS